MNAAGKMGTGTGGNVFLTLYGLDFENEYQNHNKKLSKLLISYVHSELLFEQVNIHYNKNISF